MSRTPGFVLLGGFRVIARNWSYLTELVDHGLTVLVVTSSRWRAEATSAMADPDGPGALIAETRYVDGDVGVEGEFTAAVVAIVRDWQARYQICGVLAAGEMLVEQTGIVADALGLPSPGIRATRVCRNKYLQRLYLDEWSPRATVVPPRSRSGVDLSDLKPPLVLKPSARRSSSGVRRVHDADQLATLIAEYPPAETLLVEERVDGPEYSVEALVQRGEVIFESVTEKRTTAGSSEWFVELSHTVPAPGERGELLEVNRKVLARLDFANGIAHAEYRVDPYGRVVLMELAARTPGDGILPLYHMATGVPIEPEVIRIALGEQAAYPQPRRIARQVYIEHPNGVLRGVDIRWPGVSPIWVPEGEPWPTITPGSPGSPGALRHLLVLQEPGTRLGELRESGDRAVTFLVDAASRSELDDLEARVRSAVVIDCH